MNMKHCLHCEHNADFCLKLCEKEQQQNHPKFEHSLGVSGALSYAFKMKTEQTKYSICDRVG